MVQRLLPYTRGLVSMALYDILDEEGVEYEKDNLGHIVSNMKVYGNESKFSVEIGDMCSTTRLLVSAIEPSKGLSSDGIIRAETYLADRVEQQLENELKIKKYLNDKGGMAR